MSRKIKNIRSAFTMVELMVVILIVGILTAVAVPAYNSYTFKAKISEAYTTIDAMTKSQVAYFLIKKRFSSEIYTSGLYPAGTTVAGGRVSAPYSVGIKTTFKYQTFAGRNDSSGNPLSGDESDGNYIVTTVHSWSPERQNGSNCQSIRMGDYVSPAGKSQYNWVILAATREFNPDPDNDKCTFVLKLLETTPDGKINAGNPIFPVNLGD